MSTTQTSSTSEQQEACSVTSVTLSTNAARDISPIEISKEQRSVQRTSSSVVNTSPKSAQGNLNALSHHIGPLSKELVPTGSAQQQALQQQALHQAALHHQALRNHSLQSAAYYSFNHPVEAQQLIAHEQRHCTGSAQSTLTQLVSTIGANMEPMDMDKSSYSGNHDAVDSSTMKVSEVESKTSGRLVPKGGAFTDLNAEPFSEGEILMDSWLQKVQPGCCRTKAGENTSRKEHIKDLKPMNDEPDDFVKVVKCSYSRSKARAEKISEVRVDTEMHSQLVRVPMLREEIAKNLKAGLIQVVRRMPKNAHAHFALGLMYQRLGQPGKAVSAFLKASEVLKLAEEELGQNRGQFLALVQCHHAQSLLQSTTGSKSCFTEKLQEKELVSLVNSMKEAMRTDPGQAVVWNTLGLMLLQNGQIRSSIAIFKALLSLAPDCLDAVANLGVAYLHSGKLLEATHYLQLLIENDSSHPGALVNYGTLLLYQYGSIIAGTGAGAGEGAYDSQSEAAFAAQQCLLAALKAHPKADHIWANLAAAYAISKDFNNASKCLQQASKLEPNRLAIRYAVAMQRVCDSQLSHDVSEQLSWAANEISSILKGHPAITLPHISWAGLAMVNRAQHETAAAFDGDVTEVKERAFHTLQQAVEEYPDDAVQWHQLGLHTLRSLQFTLAQSFLKNAIFHRDTCAIAWSNLGIALQLSENSSPAEEVYLKALSLVADEQAHSIWSNLGNLYRQQKRFSDARKAFNEALSLCPHYAPACNNLGLLLVAECNYEEAIKMFDRALLSDPLLDAAKSNKMKAEALQQMHRDEALAVTRHGLNQ